MKFRLKDVLFSVGIIALIFVIFIIALALIAGGMFVLPSALLRILSKGDFIISDLPPVTMLCSGGAMLFIGLAALLWNSCKICPKAASFIFGAFSGDKR